MADERGARVQVEGAVSEAPGRARGATELAAAASLRIQPLCRPADLSGDGCGRKRRRHQARDVRRQPARLPGIQLQTSQRRRTAARFSVAHHPRSAGTRADRHLQPLLLRGGADRPRASGDSPQRRAPGQRRSTRRRSGTTGIVRSWIWRDISTPTEPASSSSSSTSRRRSSESAFSQRIDEPEKNWKFSSRGHRGEEILEALHEGL